jgi:cystathionine beta-lyase family protein involved in aluminum resistance
VKALLRLLVSRGVAKKGLRGGSSLWLAIGALQFLMRLYNRKGKRSEAVTLAERIRPGDELIVRYPGKPSRKTKREISTVQKNANTALRDFQRRVNVLEAKRDSGGRSGRKATEALRALVENGSK